MEKTIGILGGMGPLATADLFRKITLLTDAARDNDHIRVYIDSNARIPDRTAAILSGGKDPVPEMASALRSLEACGASCVIMPCNTAHYFLPRLQAMTKLPFISMLEATAKTCAAQYPGRTAAVLATKGTLATGLYEQALAAQNVRCLIPDAGEQDVLMHLIYDIVKASRPLAPEEGTWQRLLDALRARGADYFILGCTELPARCAGPFLCFSCKSQVAILFKFPCSFLSLLTNLHKSKTIFIFFFTCFSQHAIIFLLIFISNFG